MSRFIAWRAAGVLVVLVAMVGCVFLLRQVIPSDPARAAVGPNAPASVVEAKRAELGLDKPLPVQFVRYLDGLAHGDLGTSTRTHRPVATDIRGALPATVELLISVVVLAALIGIGLALLQVLLPRAEPIRLLLLGGASAPIFLTALLLLLLLWFKLGLLPGSGRSSLPDLPTGPTGLLTIDGLIAGRFSVAWDAMQHLFLPALTLALPMGVAIGRSLRSSLVNVLRQDYVRTARSKGISEVRIITRHGLRNASTAPLAMAGLQMGLLFANILIIEQIFAWPGLGLYTEQALQSSDLTAVLGVALVFGVAYIVINALIDLAQVLVDPRVQLQ